MNPPRTMIIKDRKNQAYPARGHISCTGNRFENNGNLQYKGFVNVTECIHYKLIWLHAIQIKICAEYRDMLPRPRLVCQEPGLKPIGRSPGVPDKSSRGLGSMSRYSAHILICFIAYISNYFIPLWLWLGTLQDCHHAQCPLPLSIVIRMRLVIRQAKLLACLAEVQLAHEHSLAFMPLDWWNLQI